jgi:hypothetical protein
MNHKVMAQWYLPQQLVFGKFDYVRNQFNLFLVETPVYNIVLFL